MQVPMFQCINLFIWLQFWHYFIGFTQTGLTFHAFILSSSSKTFYTHTHTHLHQCMLPFSLAVCFQFWSFVDIFFKIWYLYYSRELMTENPQASSLVCEICSVKNCDIEWQKCYPRYWFYTEYMYIYIYI